jgi:hypothetical protein
MADPPAPAGAAGPASPERYTSVIDVHVILRRDDTVLLLLRRAGDTWASGQLCLTGVRAGSPAVAC